MGLCHLQMCAYINVCDFGLLGAAMNSATSNLLIHQNICHDLPDTPYRCVSIFLCKC